MGTVTGRGGYNAICDVCGFQYKNFELKKRWDGLMVCKDDWETRHPQEFVRSRNDQHPVPYVRKETLIRSGVYPDTLAPTNIVPSLLSGTFGVRFIASATPTRFVHGVRIVLGTLSENRARPYSARILLWRNSDPTTPLLNKAVEVYPGYWNSFPVHPEISLLEDDYTIAVYKQNPVPLGYEAPRTTLPASNNGLVFTGCHYNLTPGTPTFPNSADDTSGYYLIDVITRDGSF